MGESRLRGGGGEMSVRIFADTFYRWPSRIWSETKR